MVSAVLRYGSSQPQACKFPVICETLAATRPTAVNLFWAIDRMKRLYAAIESEPIAVIRGRLIREAQVMRLESASGL